MSLSDVYNGLGLTLRVVFVVNRME